MPAFTTESYRIKPRGINLSQPLDALAPDDYPSLSNVRLLEGSLVARPGQVKLFATQTGSTVHSIRRLNTTGGSFTRFLGIDSALYSQTGGNDPSSIATGFSGDPLSMVRFRPDQSPEAYMYVADSNKMVKAKVGDTSTVGVGIAPPTAAPTAELSGAPQYNAVDDFNNAGSWSASGIGGTPTQLDRVTTSIAGAFYDSGPTGWGNFTFGTSESAWLRPGVRMKFADGVNAETTTVTEVHNKIADTTIAAIVYDSGSTGLCSIALTSPTLQLGRNTMIVINASETVRVLSVSTGLDGLKSIRCSTVNTHSAGQTVTGLKSFRAFTTLAYTTTGTIEVFAIQSVLTGSGVGTVFKAGAFGLANFPGGRPITLDDHMHISIRTDVFSNIIQVRVLISVDSTATDFNHNHYEKVFTPDQITLGANDSWNELDFRLGDMQRFGSDLDRGFDLITRVGVEFTVAGNTTIGVSSWYVGGGFGPDVVLGSPVGIFYRCRYRDSRTGAKSVPGPTTRHDLFPLRQSVTINPGVSNDTQVDSIDIERLDPILQSPAPAAARFTYVGTVTNSGTPSFDDTLVAQLIAANPALQIDVLRPFPTLGKPLSGVVNVAGTTVTWVSGSTFPTNLVAGAVVLIDKVAYQVYSVNSTTQLELTMSAGARTAVVFSIVSPILAGTPLPYIFGPLEGPTASFVFGLGDTNNPGTLYWTNGNNPDGAADTNSIEVSPPSEPLVSGVVWQTYVFVGTKDRLFLIQPTFDQPNLFTPIELPSSSGFWSRWGVAKGIDGIYFWGRDGLYRGTPYYGALLISKDLWPLFPHDGAPGVSINGYQPPDMTVRSKLRVAVADADVYFDYQDTTGKLQTMRYARGDVTLQQTTGTQNAGYFPHTYGKVVSLHYWEEVPESVTPLLLECTTSGYVMVSKGLLDDTSGILCTAQTPYFNQGDARSNKYYGDEWFILNNAGNAAGFSVQVLSGIGKDAKTLIPTTTVGAGDDRRGNYLLDLSSGVGALALNISATISWTTAIADGPVSLQGPIEWKPSFVPKPPDSLLQATDWTDDGHFGAKWVMALLIEADTTDASGVVQTRSVQVQYDGGVNAAAVTAATLQVTHAGQTEQPYSVGSPFVGHNLRLLPTDANTWRLFRVRYIWVPYPALTAATTPWTDDGNPSAKLLQGMVLPADTGNLSVSFSVQGDAGKVIASISATFNGQDEQAFSWPPVVTHLMRIVPTGAMRIFFDRIKWVWAAYPELARYWTTHQFAHGLRGFGVGVDATIHYQSVSSVDFAISTEVSTEHYTLSGSGSVDAGGAENRVYFRIRRQKGRLWGYSAYSDKGFRLFGDSTIRIKEWAGDTLQVHPVGQAIEEGSGARI